MNIFQCSHRLIAMIATPSMEQTPIAKTPSRLPTLNYRGDAWCQSKTTSGNFRPTSALRWSERQVRQSLSNRDDILLVSYSTAVRNRKSLVVRTCVLEDMNSQCGTFKFQNDTLKGCLLTCDYDGCNGGHRLIEYCNTARIVSLSLVAILFWTKWQHYSLLTHFSKRFSI